jgi:hypothetical protein
LARSRSSGASLLELPELLEDRLDDVPAARRRPVQIERQPVSRTFGPENTE